MFLLEAKRRMQKVLEWAYEAGKMPEEQVFDRVIALGKACMRMQEWDECLVYFKKT